MKGPFLVISFVLCWCGVAGALPSITQRRSRKKSQTMDRSSDIVRSSVSIIEQRRKYEKLFRGSIVEEWRMLEF